MGDTLSEKAYIQSRKEAINVTYDELVNLTNTSALKPQSCYRITDYRTVHNIMDTNNMAVGINVGLVKKRMTNMLMIQPPQMAIPPR
jgi:hypothetical protein